MELSIYDVMGLSETNVKLEPARRCAFKCSFCHVEMSRRAALGRAQRKESTRDDFFKHAAKVFGGSYDPTDFRQWWLHENYPICFASGVEPFQNWAAARDVLDLGNAVGLRWFIQTRGMNWDRARSILGAFPERHSIYVSLITLDEAKSAQFEVGVPTPAERLAVIRDAHALGFKVLVGISPHFWEWIADLPALVDTALEAGADCIVFSPLKLSSVQAAEITSNQDELKRSVSYVPTEADWSIIAQVRATIAAAGKSWITHEFAFFEHGVSSVGTKLYQPTDAKSFPYYDYPMFEAIDSVDDGTPFRLDWADCLDMVETLGGSHVSQPFAWGPFRTDIHAVRHLGADWEAYFKAAPRPFSDYLNALWNHPGDVGFVWRHPFVRPAVKPTGEYWRDDAGNVIAVYDPDCKLGPPKLKVSLEREVIESLEPMTVSR